MNDQNAPGDRRVVPNSIEPAARGGCLNPILAACLYFWILLTAFGRPGSLWAATTSPEKVTPRVMLTTALIEAAVLLIPLAPLASFWKRRGYRELFATWAMAAVFPLFMLPVDLIRPAAVQDQALANLLLALGYCSLILLVTRRRIAGMPSVQAGSQPEWFNGLAALFGGLLLAAIMAMPWAAWGAFGSVLDSLLQGAAALAIGLAASLLLERFFFLSIRSNTGPAWYKALFGGFGASATLAILASGLGFGYGGMQFLLVLVLPGVGWAVGAYAWRLKTARWSYLPAALLFGLAAAAPMTLIDPPELVLELSLSAGEIAQWALAAAVTAGLVALGAAALLLLTAALYRQGGAPLDQSQAPGGLANSSAGMKIAQVSSLAVAAALAGLVALGIYAVAGRPGFYGEHMFVILKNQPDLSKAMTFSDYPARRRYVYSTLVETADRSQAEIRSWLNRLGIPYTAYYIVNGIDLPANPALRAWLASRPDVDRILDSPRLRPLPDKPSPIPGSESAPAAPDWNLRLIKADQVWNELGVTGKGIVVGQSDSGVDGRHPELASSYRGQGQGDDGNWLDPWYHSSQPVDLGGHGTHTLATVVGQNTGVAPGAQWYACVNLARNLGNPPYYLDCMQFMLAPYPQKSNPLRDGDPARGAMVINNSWGCPEIEGCDPNTFLAAVRALRAAGTFVVVSAGNDGPGCATLETPPAIYSEVFSVGAINKAGNLAEFSSIGPVTADGSQRVKPDTLAPGENVLSALPGGGYGRLSGTSMAGPHVVGVVALMWSANPKLIGQIDKTEQILKETTQPYQGPLPACPGAKNAPSTASGYGIVDAYAAVKAAMQLK